jgi:hypothetical protein
LSVAVEQHTGGERHWNHRCVWCVARHADVLAVAQGRNWRTPNRVATMAHKDRIDMLVRGQ